MKKVLILLVMMVLVAAPAIALDGAYGTKSSTHTLGGTNTLDVTPSKGVAIYYDVNADPYDGYAIASYHDKGSKTFMTSSGDTKIFFQDATAVNAPAAPTGVAGTVASTGWTEL